MSLRANYDLPTSVALKATYGSAPFKYLGVEDDGKVGYTIDEVVNQRVKFAIEFAGKGLAHIRSCYNNKYWVRSSESEYWIVATAKDPVEDKSAWNCTLFRTNTSDDGNKVTFVHVQLGKTVGRRDAAPDREMYLCLEPIATTPVVSAVVDYGSLVILPRYVAFKDENDHYFYYDYNPERGPFIEDGALACTFDSPEFVDDGYSGITFEVFTTRDGQIYVKAKDSNLLDEFYFGFIADPVIKWFLDDTLFCCKHNPGGVQLFSALKVDDKNFIALRHIESNKILERKFTRRGDSWSRKPFGLVGSTNKAARLQVVEPVLRRQVDVIEFHLDRARIYDRQPLTLAEQGASNPTNSEQDFTLQFAYTKTSSSTWSTTESWNIETNVSLTSGIPFIEEATIEIGGGYSHAYEWGGTVETSEQVTSTYAVKVPPMTKARITGIATQGKCDVPFSYVKVDTMKNGEQHRTTSSDGLYTGINSYSFDYDVVYEPIKQGELAI